MHIYFGTVVRAAPVKEGGSLFKLDWDRKEIIGEVPNVPIEPTLYHDPNARGNVRDCRGIRDENLKHAHNLIMEEPGVVYINDTRRVVIRQYDLESGQQVRAINVKKMRGIKSLLWKSAALAIKEMGVSFFGNKKKATARPLYLRVAIHGNYIYAGFSPATIVRIDKTTGKLVDYYFHSNDLRVCIHGLTCG